MKQYEIDELIKELLKIKEGSEDNENTSNKQESKPLQTKQYKIY